MMKVSTFSTEALDFTQNPSGSRRDGHLNQSTFVGVPGTEEVGDAGKVRTHFFPRQRLLVSMSS